VIFLPMPSLLAVVRTEYFQRWCRQ